MHKRVVITGLGLISPLSHTAHDTFKGLCNLELGVDRIPESLYPEVEDLPVKIAGLLPKTFDLSESLSKVGLIKTVYNALSLSSCKAAFLDSKLPIPTGDMSEKIGLIYGTDKSSPSHLKKAIKDIAKGGYDKLDPLIVFQMLVSHSLNTIASELNIKGYANAVSAGFATGQISVNDAYRAIKLGYADVMIAGASEVEFDASILMSFYKSGMLSRSSEPEACKPFDIARDGIRITWSCFRK